MKNSLIYIFLILILLSEFGCSKRNISDLQSEQINLKVQEVVINANTICGSANPNQSLLWLKEIISKAEEDKQTMKYKGNYMGKVVSTSYHNQSVFYITMPINSGGVYAYVYDCNGKSVNINSNDIIEFEQNAQQGRLIYSNGP